MPVKRRKEDLIPIRGMLISFVCLVVVCLLWVYLSGCAMIQGEISWGDLTTKGKAALAMSIYNEQFKTYQEMTSSQSVDLLTEDQKEILRVKRKILTEMKPLLQKYADYVKLGQIPDEDVEATILNYLERLLGEQP